MSKSGLRKLSKAPCPNCRSLGLVSFYESNRVPVHSVLLHRSRAEAIEYPRGDISLGFCKVCGFITNVEFDPGLQNYLTHNYEATQAFSDTFNSFHQNLALRLISQYKLHGKKIIEIGCGQGEFLDLLCNLGENHGIGFDPAYRDGQARNPENGRVVIVKDYYSEKYASQYHADFICCKMTLEHIHDPYKLVSLLSSSTRNLPDTIIFFQVPNAQLILRDLAFWDIYYEHCSYFSLGSLSYLFQSCGFEVMNTSIEYDDQYLTIEARPRKTQGGYTPKNEDYLPVLEQDLSFFQANYQETISTWRQRILKLSKSGKKVVLWGGGSKAVAFLHTLQLHKEIEFVIDINPNKNGTFIAGTGQKIVSPAHLNLYKPDMVIVMNPVYKAEVQRILGKMEIFPEVVPLMSMPEQTILETIAS